MKRNPSTNAPRERLHEDHQAIDELFQNVLEAARANDPCDLPTRWTEFESRVLSHLDGEEQYLLQPLGSSHPTEVAALYEHHQAIRNLIAEMGVETDLHAVRLEQLEELGKLLRAHAELEDRGLYPWAETELGVHRIGSFFQFLKRRSSDTPKGNAQLETRTQARAPH